MALENAEEAFKRLDRNGNGFIDKNDLRHIRQEMNSDPTTNEANIEAFNEANIEALMQTCGNRSDGTIQLSDWLDFFGGLFDSMIPQDFLDSSQAQF